MDEGEVWKEKALGHVNSISLALDTGSPATLASGAREAPSLQRSTGSTGRQCLLPLVLTPKCCPVQADSTLSGQVVPKVDPRKGLGCELFLCGSWNLWKPDLAFYSEQVWLLSSVKEEKSFSK